MKYLKVIFLLLSGCIIIFLLFAFFASFSFENMYYSEEDDALIVLKKTDEGTDFSYSIKDHTQDGEVTIVNGVITFLVDNNNIATATYDYNNKYLEISGNFYHKKYNKKKFKQVSSIKEYYKAIF